MIKPMKIETIISTDIVPMVLQTLKNLDFCNSNLLSKFYKTISYCVARLFINDQLCISCLFFFVVLYDTDLYVVIVYNDITLF